MKSIILKKLAVTVLLAFVTAISCRAGDSKIIIKDGEAVAFLGDLITAGGEGLAEGRLW